MHGSGLPGRGRDPGDGDRGPVAEVGRYAGHGLTIALSTGLFAWVGLRLDGWLGTGPLLVLLGAFLGFGAGFYSMYHRLVLRPRSEAEQEESDATDDGDHDR